jgi:hypothetical protein
MLHASLPKDRNTATPKGGRGRGAKAAIDQVLKKYKNVLDAEGSFDERHERRRSETNYRVTDTILLQMNTFRVR